jgi:hypothetical protein
MPVKRRKTKRHFGELNHDEWISLTLGERPDRQAFDSDEDRRAAWEQHREAELASINLGRRPAAWWDYDAPARRDHNMNSMLQLFRLGELRGDELQYAMRHWADWAEKARKLHYVLGPGNIVTASPEAEERWRAWAGVPDEMFREADA